MTTNVYAVFDSKAQAFNNLFTLPNDAVAERSFCEACKDERTDLAKYPGDFTLYRVATFDIESAVFEGVVPPALVARNDKVADHA